MNDLHVLLREMAAEPWAMEPTRLEAFFARVTDFTARPFTSLPAVQVDAAEPQMQISADGTAQIPVVGILTKQPIPKWLSLFGIVGTTYGDIRRMVGEAVATRAVERIELRVESPGGQVPGVQETAEAIAAAAKQKPVTAVVEDLAASGAYWLAAQAGRITANANAFVGSIGVYTVYQDWSKAAENLGVTVHVIRSGEHKGMGVVGAPITEAQIAAMQENIDRVATHFIDAVAAGRGLERADAAALATGRLWEATAAVENRLIDAVGTATVRSKSTKAQQGDLSMDTKQDTQQAQQPAVDTERVTADAVAAERQRLADLRAAFPKDPEFAMQQFEAGASVTEAKAAYVDILQARIDAREKATVVDKAPTGADARIGHSDAQGNEPADADDGRNFLVVSREYARQHGCKMTVAMQAVRRQDRALHERYLEACKAKARPRGEKLERVG